jgi:hypothetical protein
MTTKKVASSVAALALFATVTPAFAQVTVNATVNSDTNVNVGTVNTTTNADVKAALKLDAATARSKDRGNQEIDRRTAALNELSARLNGKVHLSDEQKSTLSAMLQAQIADLAALKAKIEGGTDLATLKTDVKSITGSYRIFALVLPQGRIAAAADSISNVADSLTAIGVKLQARITASQTAGADVTEMNAAFADFTAKLASAKTQAAAAVSISAALKPDNGDKTLMKTNMTALKDAQAKLKAAHADLRAAREDVRKIATTLKSLNATASSTTNVQVTQ